MWSLTKSDNINRMITISGWFYLVGFSKWDYEMWSHKADDIIKRVSLIDDFTGVQDTVDLGSQTQMYWRAAFTRKIALRATVQKKNLLWASIYKKSPKNVLKLIKIYNLVSFLSCSRSAQMHLWDPCSRQCKSDIAFNTRRNRWNRILSFAPETVRWPI